MAGKTMIIGGNKIHCLVPSQSAFIPSAKIYKSNSSRRRVYDHGANDDVRVAYLTAIGKPSETDFLLDYVGDDTVAITFESGEPFLGSEVRYTSPITCSISNPVRRIEGFGIQSVTFEAHARGCLRVPEKVTSLDGCCIDHIRDSYFNQDLSILYANDGTIKQYNAGIKTSFVSCAISGSFLEISKLKNYIVSDIRCSNELQFPLAIFPDGGDSGYIVDISETYYSSSDCSLSITLELPFA